MVDLFGPWFDRDCITVSWIFYYDLLCTYVIYSSVSLAVHIYATVYMRGDPHFIFCVLLSLLPFSCLFTYVVTIF
jgi:NADH:ubiquinone oxidoreductase subunit 5 (subunit L)/multisubunit Na+/H+ antiporter MnhA subunit